MKPSHRPPTLSGALAVLLFSGWCAAPAWSGTAGVTVHSLTSPIPGRLAGSPPASRPAEGSKVGIQRHSGPKPPLAPQARRERPAADSPAGSSPSEKDLVTGPGFDAIDEVQAGPGKTPPDPNVAISPVLGDAGEQYLVETVNEGLQIFDRNGVKAGGYLPFATFFSGVTGPHVFDPRLVFDPYAQRFFVIALENGLDNKGYIHIAVSRSMDPRAGWNVFKTSVPAAFFPDYPSLGMDRKAIYIGVNLFAGGQLSALLYRAVGKATMLDNSNPQITQMVDVVEPIASTQHHWAMRAVQGLDLPVSAPAEGQFIGPFRDFQFSGTVFQKLRMVKMRQPLDPAQVSLASFDVAVPGYRAPAVDAPQNAPDCTLPIGPIDVSSGQLLNAVWRRDDVYTAHTVRRQTAAGTTNAARWYQIRTGPPGAPVTWSQLVQSGEIYGNLSISQHTYLPTVGVDAKRSLMVAYAQSSPNEPVSFRVAGRGACEPEGQMDSLLLVKSAAHCYEEVSLGTPPHRWGDYWAVAVDPASPTLLWAVGEYVKAKDSWGTWVQSLEVIPQCPECACYLGF